MLTLMPEDAYWAALAKIGLGYRTVLHLLQYFDGVTELWNASEEAITLTGLSPAAQKLLANRATVDPLSYFEYLQRSDTCMLTIPDPRYPPLLKEIHSPPLLLFVRGAVESLQLPCLTVVGTRHASNYGLTATRRLLEPLVREGTVIVSGLAYGIDTEAHTTAVAAHAKTIAVLGNGIDEIYPRRNQLLAESMMNLGGALVSEFPPGVSPQRHFFPQRNRIVAGLSRATLVVEAGSKSGALITARFALDENRDVLAVPGPITSETSRGTNNLIKLGATPATDPNDLRTTLGLDTHPTVRNTSDLQTDSPEEFALLSLLSQPRHIDELVTISHLSTSVVNATLSWLEIKGRIKHLGGMHYVAV